MSAYTSKYPGTYRIALGVVIVAPVATGALSPHAAESADWPELFV
ncbi:hypothetical protein [Streptomyces sp. LRa12]|nr:hypothetical protein [Streptomyces sp. LRa12]